MHRQGEVHVIQTVMNRQTAGTGDTLSSSRVDMQTVGSGGDGVLFIVKTGDCDNTCVLTFTIKENTSDSTTGATATSVTASRTCSASDTDNKVILVEISRKKITKRYVYLEIARATANAIIESVVASVDRTRAHAVSQHSDTVAHITD